MIGGRKEPLVQGFLKRAKCILNLAKTCQKAAYSTHFWSFRRLISVEL
jgi:hypothetical protein